MTEEIIENQENSDFTHIGIKSIKPKSLLFNDQDNDSFIFYDLNSKLIIENYKLPSAFTQTFLSTDSSLLCAFNGAILNYDFKNRKVNSKNNVKKLIKNTKIQNFVANPPYINKILYNEKISQNNIYISLLNGSIISIDKNSKKNFIKNAHHCNILDYKFFKNDTIITLGKDKKIKFLNINEKLETKFYIDLNESATNIETWDFSCFDIGNNFSELSIQDNQNSMIFKKYGFNYENEIYLIDSNSKILKRIILK